MNNQTTDREIYDMIQKLDKNGIRKLISYLEDDTAYSGFIAVLRIREENEVIGIDDVG